MEDVVLRATGVRKSYGGTDVLRGISLEVRRGEVKVVIGPSGSGKSTLLRLLALLEPANAGEIELEGRRVGWKRRGESWVRERERELARHRSEVGMVFQRFNLFQNMTALENVTVGLTEVRRLPRAAARERALELLERVGMLERKDAYPDELSGGQQQRVAIARALVMRPKVMLFDEPTSALDPELVREVLDVMAELAREGTTMLVVSHELAFAREVADAMVMMDDGLVVEEAPPERFFAAPAHERTRRFLAVVG